MTRYVCRYDFCQHISKIEIYTYLKNRSEDSMQTWWVYLTQRNCSGTNLHGGRPASPRSRPVCSRIWSDSIMQHYALGFSIHLWPCIPLLKLAKSLLPWVCGLGVGCGVWDGLGSATPLKVALRVVAAFGGGAQGVLCHPITRLSPASHSAPDPMEHFAASNSRGIGQHLCLGNG